MSVTPCPSSNRFTVRGKEMTFFPADAFDTCGCRLWYSLRSSCLVCPQFSICLLSTHTVCWEWFWTPRFLEWGRHHFLGQDGLWESPQMPSFIQFRGPHYDFSRKTEFHLRNNAKLPNLWYNDKRGRGIGQNWTYGVIPTTHSDLKNDVSHILEIWGTIIAPRLCRST